jgi:hypothetical protein
MGQDSLPSVTAAKPLCHGRGHSSQVLLGATLSDHKSKKDLSLPSRPHSGEGNREKTVNITLAQHSSDENEWDKKQGGEGPSAWAGSMGLGLSWNSHSHVWESRAGAQVEAW